METQPTITRVYVFTLYGDKAEKFDTPEEAVEYIKNTPGEKSGHLVRVEVQIKLANGEYVDGTFHNKDRSIYFIENRQF